jgi:hypothetical protein
MAKQGEYRFEIEAFTPTTLSMQRLTEYLKLLVDLFGNEKDVNFIRVDEGSAVPCIFAHDRAVPKIQRRLSAVQNGVGSQRARQALQCLNKLLADDDTSAVLRSPYHGVVIPFPGNKAQSEQVVGPVSEHHEITGEVIQIGGRDESISIHVRSGEDIYICSATRDQGRSLAKYIFGYVRFIGEGRWVRSERGAWDMIGFEIKSFDPVGQNRLSRAIQDLRTIGGTTAIDPIRMIEDVLRQE